MKGKNFDEIARNQFSFLISDYGCRLMECKEENWGYNLLYLNDTTGVKITYEYREAYIFIVLYKLVNGRLVKNPGCVDDDTELHGYGLDDIVNLRNPDAIIKPAYEYGDDSEYHDEQNGMTRYVSQFAKNLKQYGYDVLLGDFSIFEEIEKIVKKRAREYR